MKREIRRLLEPSRPSRHSGKQRFHSESRFMLSSRRKREIIIVFAESFSDVNRTTFVNREAMAPSLGGRVGVAAP